MYTSLLLGLVVGLLPTQARPDQPADEARAIIRKAIQALGGERSVARLRTARIKATGDLTLNDTAATFTLEFLIHTPGRVRMDMELLAGDASLRLVRVRNAGRGWEAINGQAVELSDKRLREVLAWGHLFDVRGLLPLLEDKNYRLSLLGEIRVDDRPAVGVKVSAKGQTDTDLYFDKARMLLVKSARWSLAPNDKEVTLETFYHDYRDVEGIPQPMKHALTHDGKKFIEMEITQVRFLDRVDDAEFGKP